MAYPYQQIYQPYPSNAYPTQPNTFPTQPNALPTQPNVLPTQQNALPQPQIQNGGFISVPNEDIVKTYPVAPGNCVTFKIEGKPIVLEKSMGFSQLEAPRVDRYRLVKEEIEEVNDSQEIVKEEVHDGHYDEIKTDIDKLWGAIDEIKASMEKPTTTRRKKDDGD